ncbi:hypothetical protein [Cellulomonas palmilytica]|uniref:hypothetical protein n=1 Tax=Cellulomonas palmilytica TaxID=2608402 RepID=UPI001F474B51|nr:hypothetical protein [Cellulomonas palmilytica]UJP40400.1 hypothetical protein F1D97_02385 [Cellulomonas palmilytica]
MPRRPGSSSAALAVPRPVVVHADEHPSWVIASRVAAGEWTRAGCGVYVPTSVTDPRALVVARAVGVHRRTSARHVFSHTTAAVLHGLALWEVEPHTHVRHEHRGSGNADPAVRHHRPLPPDEHVTSVIGLPVTDLALTVRDCLVGLSPLAGLVVADGALRVGLAPDRLADLVAGARGPGSARARLLVALADDGAESARETMARFAFLRAGWPPPQTQVRVVTPRGTYWADLGWPQWKVAVEYDGVAKYTDAPRHKLLEEKLRRDAFAEAGWQTVHLTAADTISTIIDRTHRVLPAGALPPTTRPAPLLSPLTGRR